MVAWSSIRSTLSPSQWIRSVLKSNSQRITLNNGKRLILISVMQSIWYSNTYDKHLRSHIIATKWRLMKMKIFIALSFQEYKFGKCLIMGQEQYHFSHHVSCGINGRIIHISTYWLELSHCVRWYFSWMFLLDRELYHQSQKDIGHNHGNTIK